MLSNQTYVVLELVFSLSYYLLYGYLMIVFWRFNWFNVCFKYCIEFFDWGCCLYLYCTDGIRKVSAASPFRTSGWRRCVRADRSCRIALGWGCWEGNMFPVAEQDAAWGLWASRLQLWFASMTPGGEDLARERWRAVAAGVLRGNYANYSDSGNKQGESLNRLQLLSWV